MKINDFVTAVEEMGFINCHTWCESHGDGGCVFFEKRSPLAGGSANVKVVSFNRDNEATNFYDDNMSSSYLLAKEILEDQKLPKEDRDWEPVDSGHTSVCGTAHGATFRLRNKWNRHPDWDSVKVFCVAGHGSRAAWQRSDGKYTCRSCGREL